MLYMKKLTEIKKKLNMKRKKERKFGEEIGMTIEERESKW